MATSCLTRWVVRTLIDWIDESHSAWILFLVLQLYGPQECPLNQYYTSMDPWEKRYSSNVVRCYEKNKFAYVLSERNEALLFRCVSLLMNHVFFYSSREQRKEHFVNRKPRMKSAEHSCVIGSLTVMITSTIAIESSPEPASKRSTEEDEVFFASPSWINFTWLEQRSFIDWGKQFPIIEY